MKKVQLRLHQQQFVDVVRYSMIEKEIKKEKNREKELEKEIEKLRKELENLVSKNKKKIKII